MTRGRELVVVCGVSQACVPEKVVASRVWGKEALSMHQLQPLEPVDNILTFSGR